MSTITQDLAAVVVAADDLTGTVVNKIGEIDSRVTQFHTDAANVVAGATAQISRSPIGLAQLPSTTVIPSATDDTGQLVIAAFAAGNKHVTVDWGADGQERHWNSLVSMPIGATLAIYGPVCTVDTIAGNVRADRACYATGRRLGTSEHGSPMVFRNLQTPERPYPHTQYMKVIDEIEIIRMNGNNTVAWGECTYLHDQGGMLSYGGALVTMSSYNHAMPNYIVGGGHFCQFYLSGPFVNNPGGGTTCEIHMVNCSFNTVSNDGPVLSVNKGYKRLMDNGEPGITTDLLNKQPFSLTAADAALNDIEYPGYSFIWLSKSRGLDLEADRPRIVSIATGSHGTGWTIAQFGVGIGDMSYHGMEMIGTTDIYIGKVTG
ncbi:MAG: hypothetical protein ACI8WB_000705 [Phenylobacterium sp.]|jgi:hypothetical protein